MSDNKGVVKRDCVWFRFDLLEVGPRTRSLFLSDVLYGNGTCHSESNTVLRAALLLAGADTAGRSTSSMLESVVKKFRIDGEYLILSAEKSINADNDYNCSCGSRGLAVGLDRLRVDVRVSVKLSSAVHLGDVENYLMLLFMELDKMEPLVTNNGGSTYEAFMEVVWKGEAHGYNG